MWLWVCLAVASVVLVVFFSQNLSAVHRDWENLLTARSRRSLEVLADQAETDASMLDDAYRMAVLARLDAETAEAIFLLELGMSVVEQALPDRLSRLKAMGTCCRMISAMVLVAPLMPTRFRLGQLATLAGITTIVEQFLLTAAERFRLRLAFLTYGFRMILPVMSRSTDRIRRDPGRLAAWSRFDRAVADFKRLDRDHVSAFRLLLSSLTAIEIDQVPVAH